MAYVTFLDEAINDLVSMEGSARKKVLAKLLQLESNPELGEPLGSRKNTNLTTFRKAVVGNRTYRIVYRLEPDGELVVIWVIAARADDECYKIAQQRLADHKGELPHLADLEEVLRSLQQR